MIKNKEKSKTLKNPSVTLIEMMVVVVVLAIVFGTASGMFLQARRSSRMATTKVQISENARWALDFITKDIQGVIMRGKLDYNNDSAPDIKVGFTDVHETAPLTDDVWGLSYLTDDVDGDGEADRMWYWQGDGNTHADCINGTWGGQCWHCMGESDVLYRGLDTTDVYWGHGEGTSLENANSGDPNTWNATSNNCDVFDHRQVIARFLTDNPIDPSTNDPYPIFWEECEDNDGDGTNETLFINLMLTLEHPQRPGKSYTFKRKVYMRNIDLEIADPDEEIFCQH